MRLWRLCKAQYSAEAFTGEGARRFSARWNPAGFAMVYTSMYKSLACLELFVNLRAGLVRDNYVEVGVDVPEEVVVPFVDEAALPSDWRLPNHRGTQAIGAEWVRSGRSVALRVPSAVIDGEWNVLLNPAHPDFRHITVHAPRPFRFDARMFESERST